jgi:hypothetical protein
LLRAFRGHAYAPAAAASIFRVTSGAIAVARRDGRADGGVAIALRRDLQRQPGEIPVAGQAVAMAPAV